MDLGQVAGVGDRDHPQAPRPGGQLGHGQAHDEQQGGGLDVRGAGDGEPLVGRGEEEVEPQGGRHRRERARQAVPVGGHRDHDDDQREGHVGVRQARAERHEHRRDGQRGHQCRHDREAVPVQVAKHSRTPVLCAKADALPLPGRTLSDQAIRTRRAGGDRLGVLPGGRRVVARHPGGRLRTDAPPLRRPAVGELHSMRIVIGRNSRRFTHFVAHLDAG